MLCSCPVLGRIHFILAFFSTLYVFNSCFKTLGFLFVCLFKRLTKTIGEIITTNIQLFLVQGRLLPLHHTGVESSVRCTRTRSCCLSGVCARLIPLSLTGCVIASCQHQLRTHQTVGIVQIAWTTQSKATQAKL